MNRTINNDSDDSSNSNSTIDQQDFEVEDPAPILAIAPFSLPAGFVFHVIIDDEPVRVVVPPGGCEEGDVIKVAPKPRDLKKKDKDKGGESGWKHGLCCCFEVIGTGLFWMSLFFPCIVLGQLMQRIKLNVWGFSGRGDGSYNRTCGIVTAFTLIVLLGIPPALFYMYITAENDIFLYATIAVFTYYMLVSLFWHTKLRHEYIRKFEMKQSCCCGIKEMFLSMFCTCCSLIQIGRQLPAGHHLQQDQVEYCYTCNTPTGLKGDAPNMFLANL